MSGSNEDEANVVTPDQPGDPLPVGRAEKDAMSGAKEDEANFVTPDQPGDCPPAPRRDNDFDGDRPPPDNDNHHGDSDSDSDNNKDFGAGRRLLSSSYKLFNPVEFGDRYVTFLLHNERTSRALQARVHADHLTNSTSLEDERWRRGHASVEINAFDLVATDPVLGNFTLRYPDTLLPLLEDATVEARQVLRGRMEAALEHSLDLLKREKPDVSASNDDFKRDVNAVIELHGAFRRKRDTYDPPPLHARLTHLPPAIQFCKPTLSELSAADVGTVIQVSGICIRAGPVRMMETRRVHRCLGRGCGREVGVDVDFGTAHNALSRPPACPDCGGASFAAVPDASSRADYQEAKVQESAAALARVGSVPRSLLIKLTDDLVDRCNPGDVVVVVGELLAMWQNQNVGPGAEAMVGTCLLAHSVRVVNPVDGLGGSTDDADDLALLGAAGRSRPGNLREKLRREFEAFWSGATARRRPIGTRDYLVRAVCPQLYGMHAVKLGLLLTLIGGAEVPAEEEDEGGDEKDGQRKERLREQSDEEGPVPFKIDGDDDDDDDDDDVTKHNKNRTRARKRKEPDDDEKATSSRRRIQSHILLIGDPGTGKSQFLRFAAALSPRAVLTTGTGSSAAGLTCAAVRDSGSGPSGGGSQYSLEAGALALADRGVCCIDEFGCMSKNDRTSIHEAMEQQTISVAKAGIVCKLNARATVVAVMNPTGGIYNNDQSLEQNSRLGSALLSRFDLIFLMLDQAECGRDANIAKFLLQQSIIPGSGYDRPPEMESLVDNDNVNGHWSMEKLRAYIATICEKFQPTLTREASELLENYYSLCRQHHQNRENSVITVRFLESLIRLSQAHARLMYRNEVLLDDAVAVILLMECTASASTPLNLNLRKNPVDTEFARFDEADSNFQREKQALLRRFRSDCRSSSGVSPPPFGSNDRWDNIGQRRVHQRYSVAGSRNRDDLDQYLRPLQSQQFSQTQSPYAPQQNGAIRQGMAAEGQQWTPSSRKASYAQRSDRRVTFSQQSRQDSFGRNPDSSHGNDHGHCKGRNPGNRSIHQHGVHSMSRNQVDYSARGSGNPYYGQIFEAPYEQGKPRSDGCFHPHESGQKSQAPHEQERSRSGIFLHPRTIPSQTGASDMKQNHSPPESQQVTNFMEGAPHGRMPNQGSSGKRRKKRRTAD